MTVHVLLSTNDEFAKMEEKQKLPKPKLTKQVKQVIESILKKRLGRYPTRIKVSYHCLY
jgi:SET domain-containing protein 6